MCPFAQIYNQTKQQQNMGFCWQNWWLALQTNSAGCVPGCMCPQAMWTHDKASANPASSESSTDKSNI